MIAIKNNESTIFSRPQLGERGGASVSPGSATVTVLIPCYNYARFLVQCVTSVLAQDGVSVRVLVVDDASTDDSVSVATNLARQDHRVRLIPLRKNVGMVRAVNLGLREIESEYFVKLDADDFLPLHSMARSVALLQRYPNVGFVYGWARHFTGDIPPPDRRLTLGCAAEWLAVRRCPPWTVWRGAEWLRLRCQRADNSILQPEAMIRTSILKAVGEYKVGLPHTSDLEMWLRLATISDVGRINRVVQGYYRVHPNSMQRTVNSGEITDLVGRRDAFIGVLLGASERVSGAIELEVIVRQRLAEEALEIACRAYEEDRVNTMLENKLIEFAITTFPAANTLLEWRRLEKRRQTGPRSRWAIGSQARAAIRYGRSELKYLQRIRTGI